MNTSLKIISKNIDFFYQFAFVLLPEELQAHQLVIDAMRAYKLESMAKPNPFCNEKEVLALVYSHIYKIGFRRAPQLKALLFSGNLVEKDRQFYDHTVTERSVLFFYYRLKLNMNLIERVTNSSQHEILEILNTLQKSYLDELYFQEGDMQYAN